MFSLTELVIKNSGPVQLISELTYFRDRFGEKAEFLETELYLLHYNTFKISTAKLCSAL